MIATLLMWRWFPNAAYAAAWGVLAGGFGQLFFMLWAGRQHGLQLRISWPRWTPEIREFFKALGAVTIGAASVFIAPFIDTIIASLLPTGTRTALYYADRIDQLPLGVLGIALGTVLLPEMSARLARNDRAGSDSAQNRTAALSLLLTLPFAAVFIAVPDVIMRAIFAHGAFDRSAAALSAIALAAYGVGLPAFALVRIVASTFYARHDTMTPVRATLTAIACNIALKVILVWGFHLGIAGVALGTSIGAWLNVAILAIIGRRRSLLAIESSFRTAILPVCVAALAAGAGAYVGAVLGGMLHSGRLHDEAMLGCAFLLGCAAYGTSRAAVPAAACRLAAAAGDGGVIRLFVALPLPETVAEGLLAMQSGVPGARWSTREQLHLTLRFIGEVDGGDANAIDEALEGISVPRSSLS